MAEGADASTKPRAVTIAIDPSDRSLQAVTWAAKNLVRPGDAVTLLHVQAQPDMAAGVLPLKDSPLSAEAIESIKTHISGLTRWTLDKAKGICKDEGVEAEGKAVIGEHRETICRYVAENPCSMLVVGSRGLGALQSQFLGSVSSYCVHHASVPVVVVRTTTTESS